MANPRALAPRRPPARSDVPPSNPPDNASPPIERAMVLNAGWMQLMQTKTAIVTFFEFILKCNKIMNKKYRS